MKTYLITTNGKKHHYVKLADAIKVASDIFNATGVVVGIEEDSLPSDPIREFVESMARFTLPDEEFESAGYDDADDFVSDMDDERLCSEYSTFMEMVREARAILATDATKQESGL